MSRADQDSLDYREGYADGFADGTALSGSERAVIEAAKARHEVIKQGGAKLSAIIHADDELHDALEALQEVEGE